MRIIKRGALVQFWERRSDSRASLEAWYGVVRRATWKTPAEMKQVYGNADLVGRRTVFNIRRKQISVDCEGELPPAKNICFVSADAFGIRRREVERMSTNTVSVDERTYGRLLGRTLPRVIRSDEEYDRLTDELVRLDEQKNSSPEEKELAELLTVLIGEYEGRRYPIRKASPQRTLQHLMEARSLTQKDLWKTLGRRELLPRFFMGNALSAKCRRRSWLGFSMSARNCLFSDVGQRASGVSWIAMRWFERKIRRYEHRRWTTDDNRRVRPFEWGLEHIGGV